MDKYFPVKTEVKYKVRSQRGLSYVLFSMTTKIMEWRSHFIELVGDTMLEVLTSTLQENSQVQNCLEKLEKCPKVNKRKFNKVQSSKFGKK